MAEETLEQRVERLEMALKHALLFLVEVEKTLTNLEAAGANKFSLFSKN